MTSFAVLDADGILCSTGTRVADPLPDGYSVVELTDDDAARCSAGGAWNGTGFDDPIPPAPSLAAAHLLEAQTHLAAASDATRAVVAPILAALAALIEPA